MEQDTLQTSEGGSGTIRNNSTPDTDKDVKGADALRNTNGQNSSFLKQIV